uniref:telomerase protein component 1-like isoform X2 n=1 Tax=Monopterus albus TaxID=43700 RepID=UPI0009B3BE92|nr:telomerase protein component 1-like isoform X2 [Monopterus albus]
MAMLRNLRNMITRGISEAHHKKILSRLTNKKAVIQSRQFPFRFLAAYKVIMELHTLASTSQQKLPPVKEILKGILKKIPKSRRFRKSDWSTTSRSRLKVTLGVPFIYRIYRMKKAPLLKANQMQYTVALLDRYRKALETAVQISCCHNVPPLPGRTIIMLSSCMSTCLQKQDFCLPPDSEGEKDEEDEDEEELGSRKKIKDDDKFAPSMTEVAVLLSLMIDSSAEDSHLFLYDWSCGEDVKLKSDVLLENVRSVMKQIKAYDDKDCNFYSKLLTKKNKVDNIIMLSDKWNSSDIEQTINRYREEVNNKVLVVQIFLGEGNPEYNDRNCVRLSGFSEQMLRFVAERGSSRLLDHVENLDKVYNIPPLQGAKGTETANNVIPIPVSPKLRWQGVRVFISSTFRDMHGERDMLVWHVFPELRRRAASHCLYLQEVELRWGVTEEESVRTTELCLSEVCRSQMMIGILGERYGLVPPRPVLPDLPQYSWVNKITHRINKWSCGNSELSTML